MNSSKIVLMLGHEMYFNYLTVYVKAGYNVYYPFRKALSETNVLEYRWMDQNITGEFGLNRYLFDAFSSKSNPFIGLGIKSIGGKADFILIKTGVLF